MRHSWRPDAKWVAAILFVLCAATASITYSLYLLTAHEPASGTASSVINALAEEMVDDELFAELQAAAQSSPDAEVQVNEFVLPLMGKEIADLTREEMLEKASARLANIIYFGGVEAGEAYFRDLPSGEEDRNSSGEAPPEEGGLPLEPLGLFTEETHDRLWPFALGLPLAAAALLIALALLSRGFGRLASPGLALVAGIGPFALALMALRGVLADVGEDEKGVLPAAARSLSPTIDDLSRLFTIIFVIGAALAATAVIGRLASLIWRGTRAGAPAPGEDESPGREPEEQPDYAADEGPGGGGGEFPSIGPRGVPQA